ncbi:hypothetical protein C8F01DRAFT_445330 [Mycena amicta]|nr:hypothetical protein C8F01DRAFT_445330 [Mycena amicta]
MAAGNSSPSPELSALFNKPRRVIIACTHCRKRKVRCLTKEESPVNPCQRCLENGLRCEYLTVTDQREYRKRRDGGRRNRHRGVASMSMSTGTPSPHVLYHDIPSPQWSGSVPNNSPYLPTLAPLANIDTTTGTPLALDASHAPIHLSPIAAAPVYPNFNLGFRTPPTSVSQSSTFFHQPRPYTHARRNTAPPFSAYDNYFAFPPSRPPMEFTTGLSTGFPAEAFDNVRLHAPVAYTAAPQQQFFRQPRVELLSMCGLCPPGACTCSWRNY